MMLQLKLSSVLLLTVLSWQHACAGEKQHKQKLQEKVAGRSGYTKDKFILKLAETHFLSFLGVHRKPHKHIKKKIKVPDHMWQLYHKWTAENQRTERGRTGDEENTATLYRHEDHDNRNNATNSVTALRFPVYQDRHQAENIKKAELHIFVKPKHDRKRSRRNIDYLKVHWYKGAHSADVRDSIIHKRKLKDREIGWQKFDVTEILRQHITQTAPNADSENHNNSDSHLSFLVHHSDYGLFDQSRIHTRVRRNIEQQHSDREPTLLILSRTHTNLQQPSKQNIKVANHEHYRPRRSYRYTDNYRMREQLYFKVRQQTCRIRMFELVFNHIGWDEWIIAPTSYWINFCSGICPKPLGPHFNTTNHAVIQKSVYSIEPSLVPPLCCIPTTMREQTFLYLDGFGKIVLKNPEQMIAESCGCR